MSRPQHNHAGFRLTSITVDGKPRAVARFTCRDCEEFIELTVKPDLPLNAEALANGAKQRGWAADGFRANRNLCPKCLARKPGHDPDSELRKHVAKQQEATVIIEKPTPPIEVPIREPTADQRAKIRALLEKHFDEDQGCYLDGMDDAKLAARLNLPRIVVERLRDAAYGPIRITAAEIELRAEIDTLRAVLKNHIEAEKALREQMQADQQALGAQIEALAAKLGARKAA